MGGTVSQEHVLKTLTVRKATFTLGALTEPRWADPLSNFPEEKTKPN